MPRDRRAWPRAARRRSSEGDLPLQPTPSRARICDSERSAARGELPAGGVDVAPAGQAHGCGNPVALERRAEDLDRLTARALEWRVGRVVGDQVDLEVVSRRADRRELDGVLVP